MRIWPCLPALLLLSACATNMPAYGKLADKDKTFLQGGVADGVLTLSNVDGLQCAGQYPGEGIFAPPTVQVFMQCSDGRSGQLLLTRNGDDTSKKMKKRVTAYGQGRLSDGTKFEVYLGTVSGKLKPPTLY